MNKIKPRIFDDFLSEAVSERLFSYYHFAAIYLGLPMLCYLSLGAAGIFELSPFQYAMTGFSLIIGVYTIIFRNAERIRRSFIPIHWMFILTILVINFMWLQQTEDSAALINLLLMIPMLGIMLIEPIPVAIYFILVIIYLITLSFQIPIVEIKYSFYELFSAVLITVFSFWRKNAQQASRLAEESYKNIFSDTVELVFILDLDLHLIQMNMAAERRIREAGSRSAKRGDALNNLLLTQSPTDFEKLKNTLNTLENNQKATLKMMCAFNDSDRFQFKELSLRKSEFFAQSVFVLSIRSLQEQRDYEQKLLESKENIARVLDNISSFIFNITYNVNGDHQVNYVSRKVKDVYGIDEDEYITLVKARRLSDLFYPEDREEAVEIFESVLATGESHRIRFRIVRNNEIRWVEEKIFPKKTDAFGALQLFGIVTDITEQMEAEATLAESEKRYRLIFERNMAGVYKTHTDGSILDANLAFAKILGFDSVEELKKHNMKELYLDLPGRKDYIDRLRRERFISNHLTRLKRLDGKIITLNNNVSIQEDEDGNLNIIEGTLIDITEIEDTTNKLKISEQKYRTLFEKSTEGIILVIPHKASFTIIDFNPGLCKLLNYSPDEIPLLKAEQLVNNPDEFRSIVYGAFASPANQTFEAELRRKNGETFTAEISFAQVSLGQEQIIQLVLRDISERKRNELVLQQSQQTFKNIVDHSTAAIIIFINQKLAYTNPHGEKLYRERLNSDGSEIAEIFPEQNRFIILDLIKEGSASQDSFTEIELQSKEDIKKYSVSVVKTMYNGQDADMIMLYDVTLQTEYNRQKLRAEIAEDSNKKLQDEIERHKITQAELLEKTYWLNALFESSYNLFILSLDKEFRISSFNENFRAMVYRTMGHQVEIGDVFLDIFKPRPEARKRIEDRFTRVFSGETLEFVSHYPGLTGEVWVESFLNPVKLGKREVTEISFISHEITEKIESQRRIKQSEANNRAILLALPDILSKVNRDEVFTDFRLNNSDDLLPILPFLNGSDLLGKRVREIVRDKEIAEQFLSGVRKAFETDALVTQTIELFRGTGSGRPIYFENRFSKMNENEVIVLSRNITETIEYEHMLVESVREKEILLKEVHHRVKNNLQVINSILNLQSSYVEDPKTLEIINESQNRIRSMSYIHESLYQTKDFSSINFSDYITNLVQNLVHSYQIFNNKIDLQLHIDPVNLALDQAIPCGLILNELVSNALKYAYPGKTKGKIVIEVKEQQNRVSMAVQDFGVGLPEGFSIEHSDSLGLSLVHTLVDQIDGELSLNTLGGTKFLITFGKQEV